MVGQHCCNTVTVSTTCYLLFAYQTQDIDLISRGALEMGKGLRHVQNLTLSQFASWLKIHPVPILKLTPNLMEWPEKSAKYMLNKVLKKAPCANSESSKRHPVQWHIPRAYSLSMGVGPTPPPSRVISMISLL